MESKRERLDLCLNRERVITLRFAPMRRDPLLMLKRFEVLRIRLDRKLARQQIVARVPGANLDHVAGVAQVGQVLIKYDLNVHYLDGLVSLLNILAPTFL